MRRRTGAYATGQVRKSLYNYKQKTFSFEFSHTFIRSAHLAPPASQPIKPKKSVKTSAPRDELLQQHPVGAASSAFLHHLVAGDGTTTHHTPPTIIIRELQNPPNLPYPQLSISLSFSLLHWHIIVI